MDRKPEEQKSIVNLLTQSRKMVKRTQAMSVFDHFVGLTLKELKLQTLVQVPEAATQRCS